MKWLRRVLLAVSIAGAAWVLYRQRDTLGSIHDVSWAPLLGLAILNVLNYIVIGYSHQAFLRAFDVKLRPREWVGLSFTVNFYNLFLPAQGGTALRSVYLNRRHGLAYSDFILGTAFLFCVSLTMMGGVGTTFNGLHYATSGRLFPVFLFPFIGAGLAGGIGLTLPAVLDPLARRAGWPADWLRRWRGFFRAPVLGRVIAAYLAFCALYIARIALSFAALGIAVHPLECALASVVILAATAINVTPGNLGYREAAFALIMSQFGYPPAQMILATLVDRSIQLAVLVPAGLAFQSLLLTES
jgi:uncharacterized membrane protein YbhN (UPF0104 family)